MTQGASEKLKHFKDFSTQRLFAQGFVLYGLSLALTAFNHASQGASSLLHEISLALVMLCLIVGPIVIVRYIDKRDELEAGLNLNLSLNEALWGIGAAALLVLPTLAGLYLWEVLIHGGNFHFAWSNYDKLSSPLYYEVIVQILVVAAPEEFFYRGYLQTQIQTLLDRKRVRRLNPALAIVITSLAFATAHIMGGNLMRLNTFFPGLLFGFLRLKTGGLLAPILCHALCNVLMLGLSVHFY